MMSPELLGFLPTCVLLVSCEVKSFFLKAVVAHRAPIFRDHALPADN
jgi:hypothetical protein